MGRAAWGTARGLLFTEHLLGVRLYISQFGSLNPHSNSHHPCFRDKEIEAQRLSIILIPIITALRHL